MPGSSSLCTRSAESQEKVRCECASSTAKQHNPLESTESPLHHCSVSIAQIFGVDRVATECEITVVVVSFSAFLGKGVGETTSMLILKVSSFSQTAAEEVTG